MSFLDTFCEMLVILFAISMGYVANRLHILGGEMDQKVSKLLLNITIPALILGSVISGSNLPDTGTILTILGVTAIFYGVQIIIAMIVAPILGGNAGQKGVWRYALTFPNTAFIGYPVTVALFGQGALFYAVIVNLPSNIMAYTLGTLMLTGTGRFRWKQLLTPGVISSVLALILALTPIQPPALVGEMLNFVGNITVPLSLLVVGSLLAGLPARQIFASARLWVLSVLRLMGLPVLLWLILRWMGIDTLLLNVAVILTGMPVAINGSMLCMEYGGDSECMAQSTFFTTLASIITIPLIAALLL